MTQDYNSKVLTTENGLPSDQIYCTIEDSKGFIWIGTKNGVARWDSKNFEYFTIKDGLPNNEIISIIEDSKERLWFISFNKEISYYFKGKIYNQINDTRLKNIKLAPSTFFKEYNDSFYFSSGIGTDLCRAQIDNLIPTKIDSNHYYELILLENKLKINHLNFLNPDTDYHDIGKKKYFKDKLNTYGLSFGNKNIETQFILDSVIDKRYRINPLAFENNIVIEQFNKLFIIKKDHLEIQTKVHYISKYNNDNIQKIFNNNTDIYFIDINGNIKSNDTFQNTRYAINEKIYNIVPVKKNYLIASNKNIYSFNGKLKTLDLSNVSFTHYNKFSLKLNKYKSFNSRNIKCVFQFNNDIYIGFSIGLLIKKNKDFFQLNEKRVYCVFKNKKETIWYNTTDSLYYCEERNNKIIKEQHIILNSKFKVFVNEMKEDRLGNMIFATNNGVYLYNPKSSSKYWLNEENLLSSNECNRIEIDPKDNSLWISSFNGLNHLEYHSEHGKLRFKLINRFFKDDGLNSNDINDFLIQGDSVWVGTSKGLNLIHSKNFKPDTQTIPLHINKLWVNERLTPLDTALKFSSDENNLSFDFSAIYYQRRERMAVYYKLISKNDTITKYINENKINLLALRDGNYQFLLYAFDKDYPYIHSNIKTIFFSIQPPFYKTWWFWSLFILVNLIFIGIYFYRKMLRNKNRKIEQIEIQSKLSEYSLKSLQNQMNPHFIFNSLNTIQHYISTQNEEEATTYLSQFSKLMREMLENTKTNTIALDKELEFNQRYVDLELMRYNHKFDVQFEINITEDVSEIFIPNMLLQPLIENAIKHGVANLEGRKGHIKIQIQLISEEFLEINIIDNGQGKNNTKMSTHTSTAINVINQRLELYSRNNTKGTFSLTFSEHGTEAKLILPI